MKFKGDKNLTVRITGTKPVRYIQFDDKGIFETDDPKLIHRMEKVFKTVKPTAKTEKKDAVRGTEKEHTVEA